MRGRAFVRLFPDVHAPVGDEPPDLALRSTGAYASCGPADAPAEIIVPGGGVHPCPGLVVRRDSLLRDEVQRVAGVPVTTPRRTAYDLARRCPDLVDAVVAVDALSRQGRFDPEQVLRPAGRYPAGTRPAPAAAGRGPVGPPVRVVDGDPAAAASGAARAAPARGAVGGAGRAPPPGRLAGPRLPRAAHRRRVRGRGAHETRARAARRRPRHRPRRPGAGASTASRSTRCTASPTRSQRRSTGRSGA